MPAEQLFSLDGVEVAPISSRRVVVPPQQHKPRCTVLAQQSGRGRILRLGMHCQRAGDAATLGDYFKVGVACSVRQLITGLAVGTVVYAQH